MDKSERIIRFLHKPPQQMWTTARFLMTMWLSKLPYAPHKIHLGIAPKEPISFWWSYFPASFDPNRSIFEYWGDDIGDLRFLWNYLLPGMTFIDIGAHHGVYSIIASKKLRGTGRVVAFEPSLRERERMKLHLRYNGIDSVTLEPFALAANEGKASLAVVTKGYTTMNSLRPPAINHPIKQVMVDTTSLDAYLDRRKIAVIDLLKIDTEGGELEVFRGANRLLSYVRPLIMCEVLDRVTRAWGYPAGNIMHLVRTFDYDWFDICSDGSLVSHRHKEEYAEVKNYVAVPREKQAFFETVASRPTYSTRPDGLAILSPRIDQTNKDPLTKIGAAG